MKKEHTHNYFFGDVCAPPSSQKRKKRKRKKRGREKSTRIQQKNRKDTQGAREKKKQSVGTLAGMVPINAKTSKLRPIEIFRLSRF